MRKIRIKAKYIDSFVKGVMIAAVSYFFVGYPIRVLTDNLVLSLLSTLACVVVLNILGEYVEIERERFSRKESR